MPYLDARPFFCGISRDMLESELLRCCIVNREVLRLINVMGFKAQFLRKRGSGKLWSWLNRPERMRANGEPITRAQRGCATFFRW
jgi:hypothetical protein